MRAVKFAACLSLLAALVLAGCSGKKAAVTTAPTATAPAVSILTGSEQSATYAQAKKAILQLYARHPEIKNFVYQDVVYTPETRDKVLATCRLGAASNNARERETSRVFGCAPLIFFFYSFGKQRHVTESVDVARKLFWYAAQIKGPYLALQPLTDLLQRWGVQ
jgi:hypothetical protein